MQIKAACLTLVFVWGVALSGVRAEEAKASDVSKAPTAGVSMDELANAITQYVAKDAALKGGYFLVYDSVAKKPLQLNLDKVHKDRLARVYEGVYFACADFKTPGGKVYDLDVFMKGPDAQSLQTTEITVHKEAGKPRYGWVEENGVWVRK